MERVILFQFPHSLSISSSFPHSLSISSSFHHSFSISSQPGCKASAGCDTLPSRILNGTFRCCKQIFFPSKIVYKNSMNQNSSLHPAERFFQPAIGLCGKKHLLQFSFQFSPAWVWTKWLGQTLIICDWYLSCLPLWVGAFIAMVSPWVVA